MEKSRSILTFVRRHPGFVASVMLIFVLDTWVFGLRIGLTTLALILGAFWFGSQT